MPRSNPESRLPRNAKITLKASASTSEVWIPLTKFTIFSKLPGELQLMVWKNAHFPRIVTLKPGQSQLPALLHACADSRRECIKAGYQFWIRDMNTGFVISPWQDILLLDKSSFSDSMAYHANSFHTMRCKSIKRSMLEPIERLALSINEVVQIWKQQCIHCFFLAKLEDYFPNLKELIIILRSGPLGSTHDDLYEVTDSTNPTLKNHIGDITDQFQHAQKDDSCKGIQLKFMRNEKWVT